jgi:hypothetical protein
VSWVRSALAMLGVFLLSGLGAYLGMGLTAKATFFVAGACGLMVLAVDHVISGLWKPALVACVLGLVAGSVGLGVPLPFIGDRLAIDVVRRDAGDDVRQGADAKSTVASSSSTVLPSSGAPMPSAPAQSAAPSITIPVVAPRTVSAVAPKSTPAITASLPKPVVSPSLVPTPDALVSPCREVPAYFSGTFDELAMKWGGPLAPVGTPMSYRIETRLLAFPSPWNDARISVFKVTPSCGRILVRTLAAGEAATVDSFVGQLFEARWAQDVFIDGRVSVKTGDLNVTCYAGIEEDSGCIKAVMTANHFL